MVYIGIACILYALKWYTAAVIFMIVAAIRLLAIAVEVMNG